MLERIIQPIMKQALLPSYHRLEETAGELELRLQTSALVNYAVDRAL
jgi:hypothetical protein